MTPKDFISFRRTTVRELRAINKRLDGFNGTLEALQGVKAQAGAIVRLAGITDRLIILVEKLDPERLGAMIAIADDSARQAITHEEIQAMPVSSLLRHVVRRLHPWRAVAGTVALLGALAGIAYTVGFFAHYH